MYRESGCRCSSCEKDQANRIEVVSGLVYWKRTLINQPIDTETTCMKWSRDSVGGKARAIATLRFEEQRLTSFAGLIVFQKFFSKLRLKERLRRCFAHLKVTPIYGYHRIVLLWWCTFCWAIGSCAIAALPRR